MDGTIMTFGGIYEQDGVEVLSDKIYKFDPDSETWILMPQKLPKKVKFGTGVLIDSSYMGCK